MRQKRTVIACAAAVLLAGGVLLGAAQGTQGDPLVTLSYLNSVTTPKILQEVDAKLASREKALQDRLDAAIAKAVGAGSVGQGGTSSTFSVVTVETGKSLTGGVGSEFLLRGGSAVCVAASAPGLIDSTDGSTLAAGGALAMNHLYLSTAEGRGLKATAQCTVLVRGSYVIQ